MQISDIFLGLGQDTFAQLLRSISVGRLKTFQLYERLKTRMHLQKLNTESLRKSDARAWQRLSDHDEDLAVDLSQAVLVSNIDMIKAVLDSLGIPHEDGFFMKDVDAASFLKDGWQASTLDAFKDRFPKPVLLFYINHLALEVQKAERIYLPQ